MYVHENSVGYTLYIQNDYYANKILKENESYAAGKEFLDESESYASSLDDYLNKIIDSIPELKEYEANGGGIGVVILPESTSATLKNAVSQTTNKMLDEGTNENILKGVLGIIKYNYSADIEYGQQDKYTDMHVKNESRSYDMDALNNILSKFEAIYGANGELVAGLGKFKEYVNEAYKMLKDQANPSNDTATTASSSDTKNDLVDTFIQEMDKSKDGATTGAEELNKKLYKNYIKSLNSSLTGGLLEQHS